MNATISSKQRQSVLSPRKKIEMPSDVVVSYDSQKDCYEYNAPGYHRSVQRLDPLKEGLKAAAFVGIPATAGAIETHTLGLVNSSVINFALHPAAGALLGAASFGKDAWEETGHNPIFTGFAGMLGAGAGAVALPVLASPGVFGGFVGALAATGAAGIGVGLWSMHQNALADQEAKDHGYKVA